MNLTKSVFALTAAVLFLSACSSGTETAHAKSEEEASKIGVRMIEADMLKNGGLAPTDWLACMADGGNKILVGLTKTGASQMLVKKDGNEFSLSKSNIELKGRLCNEVPDEVIEMIKKSNQ